LLSTRVIVFILGSWLLASCAVTAGKLAPAAKDSTASAIRPATIFVARRGWHIDIGFAVSDLRAPLKSLSEQLPGVKYLFFGFGDRHFLMAKNQNAPATLAALWPGPGLILVTGLKSTPTQGFGDDHVIALDVSATQSLAAQTFIWDALAARGAEASGASKTAYGPGPYPDSLYFDAVARYSGLHTCNTWAAEVLKTAGLPVRSTAVVFAGQLWRQVKKLASSRASQVSEAPPVSAGPIARAH
jgi:uncharacterized protein DUF2459